MEMPAPTEAATPTRKVAQVFPVAKAAANSGASVETEPSMSPTRPGWMTCSRKRRRLVSASSIFTSAVTCLSAKARRQRFMALFGFRQLGEKLGNLRIFAVRRRLFVKAVVFQLNDFGPPAHRLNVELADHPGRACASQIRRCRCAGSAE